MSGDDDRRIDGAAAVHAVLADWRVGMYALPDAFQAILDATAEAEFEDVIAAILPELREAFVAWLRSTYDNQEPAAAFTWVGPSARDPAARERSIAGARRWLAQHEAAALTPEG